MLTHTDGVVNGIVSTQRCMRGQASLHVCAGGIWVPGEGRKAVVGAWLLCRKRVRGGAKAAERPGQQIVAWERLWAI